MGRFYTEEEDNFILENYSSRGTKYCSKFLGKSRNSIQKRAGRLGIKADKKLIVQNDPELKKQLKDHANRILRPIKEDCSILKKEDIIEVIRLYEEEKLSCCEIAKKYKCSKGPVLKALKGIPKRKPGDYDQHFSKTQGSGESHHSWKGGIKSIYDRMRDLKVYWEWRNSILIRDRKECTKCGNSDNLEVHHKTTLKTLINTYCDKVGKIPKDLSYEDLTDEYFFDLENGITYCSDCHRNYHKENGRGLKWIPISKE